MRCSEQRSCAGDEVGLYEQEYWQRTLDLLVWQRGLAPSRAQAQGLVLAGKIAVNGQCITRAGTPVEPQAVITRLGNVRAMSVGVEKSWQRRWRHSPSTSANVSPWMWARQREGLPIVSCKPGRCASMRLTLGMDNCIGVCAMIHA